jgi:hypothetical protein
VTFNTPILIGKQNDDTAINYASQPIGEFIADTNDNSLAGSYVNGSVTLSPSQFEGDVYPVPNGDEQVNLFDWVEVGRIVAGLDTVTNSAEFQRVDCAPRATLGDGILNVQDWVQAGRYAAGLDPLTPAGGPTGPSIPAVAQAQVSGATSQVTITSGTVVKGSMVTLPITLQAQGTEAALGFSLNFDPTVLQFVSAVQGSADPSAVLNVNSNQAASGRVAIVLSQPVAGTSFAAGTQQIAEVTFLAIASATNSPVTFADSVVPRCISDANAQAVSANYVSTSVVVVPPPPNLNLSNQSGNYLLSWPTSAVAYTLQAATSLTPPATWTNVPATLETINGGSVQVTLPMSDQQAFFRLSYP